MDAYAVQPFAFHKGKQFKRWAGRFLFPTFPFAHGIPRHVQIGSEELRDNAADFEGVRVIRIGKFSPVWKGDDQAVRFL